MTERAANSGLFLDAERSRKDHIPILLRALPAVVGFSNLFLLAFAERHLGPVPDAYTLQLLLFLEMSALLGLAFTHFNQCMDEILRKTMIFPLDQWDRFLYAFRSLSRDRSILALIVSTGAGLGILFRREPALVAAALVAVAALCAASIVMFVLVLLWFSRRSTPPAVIAWAGSLGAAGVILSSLLFRYDSLLNAFVPVVWGAGAIHLAAAGQYSRSTGPLGLLNLCWIVPLLAARLTLRGGGGKR